MTARVELHQDVLRSLRTEALVPDMARRMRNVETEAKRRCPVDTGRLRSSIQSKAEVSGSEVVGYCWTDVVYARFMEEGTGIYGQRHQRVVPTSARVLHWNTREGEARFARSVKGSRAHHFFRSALSAAAE